MSQVLNLLARTLTAAVAGAGFVLIDPEGSGDTGDSAVRLLEYRAEFPDRPQVFLDVCELPAPSMITVTMWSPADLARALPTSSVDSVAIRSHSWHVDRATDATEVAARIRSEVVSWLAVPDRPRSS